LRRALPPITFALPFWISGIRKEKIEKFLVASQPQRAKKPGKFFERM
jgi:hypothetical protein